jgi:hypothetical protein
MASSIDEAKEKEEKDTIEEQPQPKKKVEETANITTTEESTNTTATSESSKKKKKQKKDSSTTLETQKGERYNEKVDKANGNDAKEATVAQVTQNNVPVEGVGEKESNSTSNDISSGPVLSVTKRTRPPYKYDPEKVTLRFLFANRDGLTVTVECKPSDTVAEVKGQLLSVWPEDLQSCSSGDQLRLICMGKGMLIPDTRTLRDCEVPVFKTHPTPVNVAIRPEANVANTSKIGKDSGSRVGGPSGGPNNRTTEQSGQGCGCVIS